MEVWRSTWRKGIAPLLSTKHLEVLVKALKTDDPRLIQGATTTPPPVQTCQDWIVEAACGLGFCGWQVDELETVSQVEEFFARLCFEIDDRLEEPAACRYFINAWDEWSRQELLSNMIPEVRMELDRRFKLQESQWKSSI